MIPQSSKQVHRNPYAWQFAPNATEFVLELCPVCVPITYSAAGECSPAIYDYNNAATHPGNWPTDPHGHVADTYNSTMNMTQTAPHEGRRLMNLHAETRLERPHRVGTDTQTPAHATYIQVPW